MSHRRKFFVLGAVVVTLLALGVSQLQAQSPLTLEGLSERISALAGTVSNFAQKQRDEERGQSAERASRYTGSAARRDPHCDSAAAHGDADTGTSDGNGYSDGNSDSDSDADAGPAHGDGDAGYPLSDDEGQNERPRRAGHKLRDRGRGRGRREAGDHGKECGRRLVAHRLPGAERVDLRALCDGNQRGRGRGGAHACAAAHASPATDGNTVRCAQQR